MSENASRPGSPSETERVVYLVPQGFRDGADDDIDLVALGRLLWSGKWIIAAVALLSGLAGLAYALLATERFRAEVLLLPAERSSAAGLLSQFGGIAQLAGLSLGSADTAEPLVVLKSKGFARNFIEEQNLLPVLLHEDWDARKNQWKGSPGDWPDVRDAVKVFDEDVRQVVQDRRSGVVTLAVEWKDPELAARWANLMAEDINRRMRERALEDAGKNVAFLKAELLSTDVLMLQQPTGRLLEIELQKLMMAKSTSEYAFRIVDAAQVPKRRTWPKRTLIVAASLLLGAVLAVTFLVVRNSLQKGTDRPAR